MKLKMVLTLQVNECSENRLGICIIDSPEAVENAEKCNLMEIVERTDNENLSETTDTYYALVQTQHHLQHDAGSYYPVQYHDNGSYLNILEEIFNLAREVKIYKNVATSEINTNLCFMDGIKFEYAQDRESQAKYRYFTDAGIMSTFLKRENHYLLEFLHKVKGSA